MAKCGITNIGGGGGIGSDELTATKNYVLSGLQYVGADTDDEKGVGVMINNGTTANQNLNAGGSFLVKEGYNPQDFTVTANSLASQTSGTVTSSKMLNGETAWVNGSKITGAIVSMGGQTINPTASQQTVASSGKYMTGNVVVNGVSNLTAANIKKGVNVGGTVGTWEGYVPGATDLYYYGNNISGFTSSSGIQFQAGQLSVPGGTQIGMRSNVWVDLRGKTYIHCQGIIRVGNSDAILRAYIAGLIGEWRSAVSADQAFTASIPLAALQVSEFLELRFNSMNCTVSRIWLT